MRDLIRTLVEGLENGRDWLLCQVVETRGSTPQKAGSLMLVRPDGRQLGTLGGGCVEAEVKQKAIHDLGTPGASVHSFVLDHDYAWADGLICGGKMVILTEHLEGEAALTYFCAYRQAIDTGAGFTEVVNIDSSRSGISPVGARFLFDAEGRLQASSTVLSAPAAALEQLRPLEERPRSRVVDGLAFLPTLPRVRLVIVGAGHVGQAVAELAAQTDFDVWVIDDRHQYANADRFPAAERVIVGPIEDVLSGLEVNRHTYALIVTRGHGHDQEALLRLAPTEAAYVGLIGSRRKIRLILDALLESGVSPQHLARVAAPVGLDIGSESVLEIAVSIVAELISRRNLGAKSLQPRGWFPEPSSRCAGVPQP